MIAAKPALATLAALVVLALAGCASEQYPLETEQAYLSACEVNASASACQCTLTWFEHHATYTEFLADEDLARTGIWPSDMSSTIAACT